MQECLYYIYKDCEFEVDENIECEECNSETCGRKHIEIKAKRENIPYCEVSDNGTSRQGGLVFFYDPCHGINENKFKKIIPQCQLNNLEKDFKIMLLQRLIKECCIAEYLDIDDIKYLGIFNVSITLYEDYLGNNTVYDYPKLIETGIKQVVNIIHQSWWEIFGDLIIREKTIEKMGLD